MGFVEIVLVQLSVVYDIYSFLRQVHIKPPLLAKAVKKDMKYPNKLVQIQCLLTHGDENLEKSGPSSCYRPGQEWSPGRRVRAKHASQMNF